MMINPERYSGHESFICRYGWLPKLFSAISEKPDLLADDKKSTVRLGIGRNMVRSIQFWGDATGIIESRSGDKGYQAGPMGQLLLGECGWDPHLENLESLWLLHWTISTKANLAAWNFVFGSLSRTRFTRKQLQDELRKHALSSERTLAESTIDQHVGIFCASYRPQAVDGRARMDDALWSPFQDLNLMRSIENSSGDEVFMMEPGSRIGLSCKVFATALSDYFTRRFQGRETVRLDDVIRGEFSPGVVFRLNENAVRSLLIACEKSGEGGFRLIDTADTQQVAMDRKVHQEWKKRSFPEGVHYV